MINDILFQVQQRYQIKPHIVHSNLAPTVLDILTKSALKLLALVFVSFICVPWSVISSLSCKEKMPMHLSICFMNSFNRKLDTSLCCILLS